MREHVVEALINEASFLQHRNKGVGIEHGVAPLLRRHVPTPKTTQTVSAVPTSAELADAVAEVLAIIGALPRPAMFEATCALTGQPVSAGASVYMLPGVVVLASAVD